MIQNDRFELPGGFIVQIKVWKLPYATTERPHALKYSLFYGRKGQRIIAYDNESGKGDHRHLEEIEEVYRFVTMEKLIKDFLDEISVHQHLVSKRRDNDHE